MHLSIAAALSTLGEVHKASEVLLRPEDSARFNDAKLPGECREDRVIVRPDGALLLLVESGPTRLPMNSRSQFALVGAVLPSAWAWADPTKRTDPAPLARVNLDARDIHCLTQGGEIHRGATVGTTPEGLVALRARPENTITINVVGSADPEKVIAAWNAAAERMKASGRTFILPTRTPKDGDRLDSFTVAELDGLPAGARFEFGDLPSLVKHADGWRKVGPEPYTIHVGAYDRPDRTLVLPKPEVKPAKNGDRLVDLTAAQIDALPEGATFQGQGRTLTKRAGGWRDGVGGGYCDGKSLLHCASPLRFLMLPAPSPKVGDRWLDLTNEQRQSLPVGAVIKEEGCITVAVWTRLPSGWSKAVVDTASSVLFRTDTGEPTKTSTIAFLPVSK